MGSALAEHLQAADRSVLSRAAGRSARDGFARLQAAPITRCRICGVELPAELAIVVSTGTYCSQAHLWDGLD